MRRHASQNQLIVNGIAVLKDLVADDVYEDLLRAAAMVQTEEDEAALIGLLAVIRKQRHVQAAALGEKTKRPNRAQRRASRGQG